MRYKKFRLVVAVSVLAMGGLAMFIGFYAFQLHLDNNQVMGNNRKILAFLGALSMGFAFWLAFSERITTSRFARVASQFLTRVFSSIANSKSVKWFSGVLHNYEKSPFFAWFDRNSWLWAVFSAVLAIFIYFWFITGAKWAWTPYTHYFDLLANAFLKGSVSLLEKPPAALANIANPYEYGNRGGIDYLWDSSYFNSRYYLYWGPVPALVATAVKRIHPSTIEDQQLVFFFLAGLAVVMAAMFHWLRTRYYPRSPSWTSGMFTLVPLLSLPMMWIINRATVYEVAIAGGQFFLLFGLYAALRAIRSRHISAWLFLAGLAWGASVNSRVNYAVAVIWFVLLISLFFILQPKKPSGWFPPLLFLFLPLILWAVGLGGYNNARFGSIFETGHRFQLTGPALPTNYGDIISRLYIIPNLYNFLARPVSLDLRSFPFISVPYVTDYMWPFFIHRPYTFYSSEPIAGIFASIPFFWLILLVLMKPINLVWCWAKELPVATRNPDPAIAWIWGLVTGGVLLLLVTLSVFIASILRYLVDIVPLMAVLSSLCAWSGLQFLEKSSFWRTILLILIVLLAVAGIAAGLFIGFTVYPNRFENINPSLYHAIAAFFNGK